MNKPLYVYDFNGTWNVYIMEYIGKSEYGTKVSSYSTKQEAETETYRLNGWELKNKIKIMAKKKTEAQEVQEVQEVVVTEIEKKITLLEERVALLNKQIDKAEIELKKISVVAVNYDKMVKTVDNLFVADLTNRYGFDGEMMYYIGAASSTMYKKPINEEIVDLISRIETLDWKGIQKINKHFMKK